VTEYLARVPLESFIADLAVLHERHRGDEPGLVEAVRLRLAELVAEPDVLPASAREGSPDRYTQHILMSRPTGATAWSRSSGIPASRPRSTIT
jgi:predicted metal-dependent enzyme (double-stranded beta helix superfamily)